MKTANIGHLYKPPTLTYNYLFRVLKSFSIYSFDDIDLELLEKNLLSSRKMTYKRNILLLRLKELKNGNNKK